MIETEEHTGVEFIGYFQTDTEKDKGIYSLDYYYYSSFFEILRGLDDPVSKELYSEIESLEHSLRFEPDLIDRILDHLYLLGIFYIPVREEPKNDFYGGIHYKAYINTEKAIFIEPNGSEPMLFCFRKDNLPILEEV